MPGSTFSLCERHLAQALGFEWPGPACPWARLTSWPYAFCRMQCSLRAQITHKAPSVSADSCGSRSGSATAPGVRARREVSTPRIWGRKAAQVLDGQRSARTAGPLVALGDLSAYVAGGCSAGWGACHAGFARTCGRRSFCSPSQLGSLVHNSDDSNWGKNRLPTQQVISTWTQRPKFDLHAAFDVRKTPLCTHRGQGFSVSAVKLPQASPKAHHCSAEGGRGTHHRCRPTYGSARILSETEAGPDRGPHSHV